MPVILDEKNFDGWLDGSLGTDALKSVPQSALPRVAGVEAIRPNRLGDHDPTSIEPLKAC